MISLNTYVEEWDEMFTNALLNEDMAKNFAESALTERAIVQVMENQTPNFKPDKMYQMSSDIPVLQGFHGWKIFARNNGRFMCSSQRWR